ncbi:MAG: hypothetical protein HY541_08540 [Deltaproteobacteria bacterium]|nr:hypothetical protein [Deltaproteobacteria bacterium]
MNTIKKTLGFFSVMTLLSIPNTWAATFTVNSSADVVDVHPGDGVCAAVKAGCTLRAAVMEANARSGPDTIQLPTGTYFLTRSQSLSTPYDFMDHINDADNDLDITDNLTITGTAKKGQTANPVIMPSKTFTGRAFQIKENVAVTMKNLVIKGFSLGEGEATRGGAILNLGVLHLRRLTLSGNNAGQGGAVFSGKYDGYNGGESNNAGISVVNCGIFDNSAVVMGGGIYSSEDGWALISNTTIADNNTAENGPQASAGGGIYNRSNMTITHSTISGNNADNGGGIFFAPGVPPSSQLNIKSTLLANNTATENTTSDYSGADMTSLGYNLIGVVNQELGVPLSASNAGPDLLDVDPVLGAFVDEALPGRTYFPLSAESPAIDAADPTICTGGALAFDQRGQARVGTCDIGAYEYAP